MSVTRLPSGRWRAQVYDAATGKNVSVSAVLGGQGTFATKSGAKRAREQARERLGSVRSREVTVRAFWERWTTDPLFARPKQSSDIRRRELTKAFVDRYGEMPLIQVGDEIVADWLAGGRRAGSVRGLCSMFNDAASAKAGRLIDRNPFQKLGISRGKGRRDQQPPSEAQVWRMIAHARTLACPSFAAWLQVAAFTGMRPGELDALRWERVDFERHRIIVAEQFNAATRTFDTPKNHLRREAPLTAHARDALLALLRESEFCFVSLRGEHWTPSSRAYHWKAVRAAAGWTGTRGKAAWPPPPATSPAGTWSTSLKCPQRTWRSRSATRTAATSSAASTATATTAAHSTGSSAPTPTRRRTVAHDRDHLSLVPRNRPCSETLMSDRSANVSEMRVKFTRSATKHRVSKDRIRHVIAHCGLAFEESAPSQASEARDDRFVILGDDAEGTELEVMAVEGSKDELVVIHAMELRQKYRYQYEEAKQWRL